MLKKNPKKDTQDDMFRSRLENIIDSAHELVKLSSVIDWDGLERDLSSFYCCDNGRPGGSIRLMAGLCFLKDAKGLSDEELCSVWRENPYFQYFCGETFFQHVFPVEPPCLSIFRKRIAQKGMERLLEETVKIGLRTGTLSKRDLQHVNVDTTVQEKAVHFPTDVRLCHRAREELVKVSTEHGIVLRQSYVRKSKQSLFMANRYMAAPQMKRARGKVKQVRNYLGRVIRNIHSAQQQGHILSSDFKDAVCKGEIIYCQTLNPTAKEKLYSWHAPEVECISKGKAHKKYEFGCKVSYATTNKSNFIIGAMVLAGRPYDGHTLAPAVKQIEALTGVKPREVQVDSGYRGDGIKDDDLQIIFARQKRGVTGAIRKRQKRRNAIEPVIAHCKNDCKVGARNWLKGALGDKINAVAIAIGFNMRKILKKIFWWLLQVLLCAWKVNKYQWNYRLF